MQSYTLTNSFKRHQIVRERRNLKRNRIIKKRGINKRRYANGFNVSFEVVPYKIKGVFSFIHEYDKAMSFFEGFIRNGKKNRAKHFIDMSDVENITIEVLLYMVSITNIWKKKRYKYKLEIKAPKDVNLRSLLSKSGLSKYYRGNGSGHINEVNIYPMCDGGEDTIDPETNISANDRCIDISDFAGRLFKETTDIDRLTLKRKLFKLTNAIAEMIRNTNDHAYDDQVDEFRPLRNWYFFAGRVQDGISFYFLDNGKGIINTAKRQIIDPLKSIGGEKVDIKIMKEIFEGKFRSRTKKPERNKGMPEIKDFFDNDDIIVNTVITNNIIYQKTGDGEEFRTTNTSFKGTLYVWILK